MNILKGILVLVFLSPIFSCREDEAFNPELTELLYEFSLEVNLQEPRYSSLQLPNNYVYIEGGVNGIVLLSTGFGEIKAFERNCSYLPRSECAKITVHPSRTFFWDSCCTSQFELSGIVKEGPANKPMVQYRTELQGSDLIISYP